MAATQLMEEHGGTDGVEGHHLGGTELPEGFEALDSHVANAIVHPRLTDEERFAKKVAAKRQQELERRARIFDAKRRTIGVDKETLDRQCLENRMRKEQEAAMNRADGGMNKAVDKQLKLIEVDRQRVRREMEKQCKDYSLQNLHFAARREYDINDPLYVRKGVPTRLGDDDPRCGPASMQQFNGEDLLKEERTRQQRAQMVNFIEQQKFERSMLTRRHEAEEAAYQQEVADITALRNAMEDNEGDLRREMQRGQQDENLRKAYESAQKKWMDKQLEHQRNQEELDFHATDPFLQEHGQVTLPSGHVDKRMTYKGSTRDEREQVFRTQLDQCAENQEKRAIEAQEQRAYAAQVEATRKHLVAAERQKQLERRKALMQAAQENRALQAQQTQNTKETNQLYTNKFAPEFFEQFGTHTR